MRALARHTSQASQEAAHQMASYSLATSLTMAEAESPPTRCDFDSKALKLTEKAQVLMSLRSSSVKRCSTEKILCRLWISACRSKETSFSIPPPRQGPHNFRAATFRGQHCDELAAIGQPLLFWSSFGLPFMFLSVVLRQFLISHQRPMPQVIALIIALAANVALKEAFVSGIGPFPEMSLAGITLAATIVYALLYTNLIAYIAMS